MLQRGYGPSIQCPRQEGVPRPWVPLCRLNLGAGTTRRVVVEENGEGPWVKQGCVFLPLQRWVGLLS